MMAYCGVLLDIDGTLVNSNDAHALAWIEALAEQGIRVRFDHLRPYVGMGGDNLLPQVSDIDKGSELERCVSQRHSEIFTNRYLPKLKPMPGAQDLVLQLHAEGYTLIAATSSSKQEAERLLEIVGVNEFIHVITSSDDADKSKPDPDILKAALRKARLQPQQAVLIGDTPYDVQAANRLGIATIALRCGGWSDDHLQGAIAIYDNPAAFILDYYASPLDYTWAMAA